MVKRLIIILVLFSIEASFFCQSRILAKATAVLNDMEDENSDDLKPENFDKYIAAYQQFVFNISKPNGAGVICKHQVKSPIQTYTPIVVPPPEI